MEITTEEYNSLLRDKADKERLATEKQELLDKNKELSDNYTKAKDEMKEKHKKQMLDLTTEKTALETKVKTFNEKLGIWEDVEDVETFLDGVKGDLSAYTAIKEEQEKKSTEAIKNYTDFIKSKDKEWEDFLKGQVEIFWEDVLKNERALKGFAEAKGYKPDWDNKEWIIKVWKLEWWETPWDYNSFAEADKNWDFEGMTDAFFWSVN